MTNSKIPIYVVPIFATITVFMIQAFLSGKIIDIPFGTREGGIISAIGVAIIMIVIFLILFFTLLIINRRKKIDNK